MSQSCCSPAYFGKTPGGGGGYEFRAARQSTAEIICLRLSARWVAEWVGALDKGQDYSGKTGPGAGGVAKLRESPPKVGAIFENAGRSLGEVAADIGVIVRASARHDHGVTCIQISYTDNPAAVPENGPTSRPTSSSEV
jgi:hypothetical protein